MRISDHVQRIGLLVVPVVVFLLSLPVADYAFRLLGDRPAVALGGLFAPFGARNYKHAPLVETDANWSTGRFTVVTDALGMRTDKVRKHAIGPDAPADVLVMGDSQGFGQGVDYEASLVGVLAQRAAGRGIRVANASVGGHYLDNQLELASWLRQQVPVHGAKPLFLLTPYLIGTVGSLNSPAVGPDGRLYGRQPTSWQQALLWVKTNTVVYARVRDAARQLGLLGDDGGSTNVLDLYPAGQAAIETERRLYEALDNFLQQEGLAGREVWIVYAPLVVEFDFEPVRNLAASKGVAVDEATPARIAASVAAALGASFLDLRPTLARLRAGGVALSLTGDPHYSEKASIASAEAIWAMIAVKESGLVNQ